MLYVLMSSQWYSLLSVWLGIHCSPRELSVSSSDSIHFLTLTEVIDSCT